MQTVTLKFPDREAARIKRVMGKRTLSDAVMEATARGLTVPEESRIPNATTARELRRTSKRGNKVFTKPGEFLAWMKTL